MLYVAGITCTWHLEEQGVVGCWGRGGGMPGLLNTEMTCFCVIFVLQVAEVAHQFSPPLCQ